MRAEILTILKQNNTEFLSGQELSQRFGVTRAAVWKCIRQLEDEGYVIESRSKNGYRLLSCPDILTEDELAPYLQTKCLGRKVKYFRSIDSTNIRARELAEKGEPAGTTVISEEQTGGKGHIGRKWYSNPYQGILMSVILRPGTAMAALPQITEKVCTAAAEAIRTFTGNTEFRAPDHILINGRKAGGVLVEAAGETDRTDYIIAGIGINVNQELSDLPEEVRNQSTSLRIEKNIKISRQQLAADILNKMEFIFGDGSQV